MSVPPIRMSSEIVALSSLVLVYVSVDTILRVNKFESLSIAWQACFFIGFGYLLFSLQGAPSKIVSARPTEQTLVAPIVSAPIADLTVPPYVAKLFRYIDSQRLKSQNGKTIVVNFARHIETFNYPFEDVVYSLRNKFQLPKDPLNPTISAVEEKSRDSGIASQSELATAFPSSSKFEKIVRDIIVHVKPWIPAVFRWAVSLDSIVISETTYLFSKERVLFLELHNNSLDSVGRMKELAVYWADPQKPNVSYYCTFLDLEGVNSLGSKLISFYQPKAGEPAHSPYSLVKAHIRILNLRLQHLKEHPASRK